MKKILAILLIFALAVGISGCTVSNGIPKEEYDKVVSERDALKRQIEQFEEYLNGSLQSQIPQEISQPPESEAAPQKVFDEKTVLSQLEIKEYKYNTDFYSTTLLVIKNQSEFTLSLDVSATFKDAEGNMVGAASSQAVAFEVGQEMAFRLTNDTEYSTCEYKLSAKQEERYTPVLSKLSVESNTTDKKVVVSVTNNGEKPAEFVQVSALFFSGEELVDYGDTYCVNSEQKINPGEAENGEISCYIEFDSVKLYLSGWASKY